MFYVCKGNTVVWVSSCSVLQTYKHQLSCNIRFDAAQEINDRNGSSHIIGPPSDKSSKWAILYFPLLKTQ